MTTKHRDRVVLAVGLLALTAGWASPAQEPETRAEKFKGKVSGAVGSLKRGALNAEEAIRERFAKAKSAVAAMGIESRVYARLHWDKDLAGSRIDLRAPAEGVIELNGSVTDAKAKAKAVLLTRDTVGVTQVVDRLVVLTTTAPATAAPRP